LLSLYPKQAYQLFLKSIVSISVITIVLTVVQTVVYAQDISFLKIPYNNKEIKIDGDISDWKTFYTYSFSDTSTMLHQAGDHKIMTFYDEIYDYTKTLLPLSKNRVEVKICWNFDNIYFAFDVTDHHLFAEITPGRKYPEFHLNDAIEIYIDTKNDSRDIMDINDYQFIIDICNNSVVLKGDRKYIESDTMTVPKDFGQNILIENDAVYSGSINDTPGNDSGYIIEIAIPFAAIGLKPETGDKMRFDLCIDDADYSFKNAETMQDSANIYYAFNWSGQNDFGYPEFWRPVILSGGPGWYEKLTAKYEQYWLLFYGLTLFISLLILFFLFYRINKLKKLPTINDLKPAQLIVFKDMAKNERTVLSHNQKILQLATEFITEKPDETIRSEDLAKEIGISLRNFQRITKAELNCTPTNFIWLVKLNMAAEFLKNKQGNVSDAAYEFGFSNPSYFSRMFKKHFGVSPKEYQKGVGSDSDG